MYEEDHEMDSSPAPEAKGAVTINPNVIQYDAEKMFDSIARLAAHQIVEQSRADIHKAVQDEVRLTIQSSVGAIIEKAVNEPIQQHNSYGEKVGEPTTLKALISKARASRAAGNRHSRDMSASHSHEWQSQSALMVSALCFSTKEKSMSQQLAPHQQRVVEEKRELDEKLQKLKAFISSASFTTIVQDADERGRLVCQEEIMKDYSAVLAERIAEF